MQLQQQTAEIDRLNARLAAASPEARTAKVAPEVGVADVQGLTPADPLHSTSVARPRQPDGAEKKKSNACVVC